ncbi:MAG TPA: tripartite tricarboxylate transporter substrate binding protein [Xanthobacteraceae bacterium]|jgi:tripartite-type tricarboxylate transporter receptor subunit TctC
MFLVNRLLVHAVLLALAALHPSLAQDRASRPIKLLVGFTPGGTTDFVARLLAERQSTELGRSVVVENRPGANGAIAAEYVARAEPDGATLLFTTVGAVAISPALRGSLPYNPSKDFAAVGLAVRNSTMLVVEASMPVHSARELADLARQKSRPMSIGVTGLGAISHLALVLYEEAAGVRFQAVPYRGASQGVIDLLAGRLDGFFADVPTIVAQVRAGKLKVLAAASQARSEIFPDVATLVEQGFAGAVANQWAGILAPALTPPAEIAKLNGALNTALADPEIRRKLRHAGVTPSPDSPAEFASYVESEITRWGKVIREKGIKGE